MTLFLPNVPILHNKTSPYSGLALLINNSCFSNEIYLELLSYFPDEIFEIDKKWILEPEYFGVLWVPSVIDLDRKDRLVHDQLDGNWP